MISAFDVYLVMQLDSLRDAFGVAGSLALVIPAAVSFLFFMEDGEFKWKGPRWIPVCGVFALLLSVALPSTKTMAAMIVLPGLTSDEVIDPAKKEAGELYDLAKQALRQAVEDKKAAKE